MRVLLTGGGTSGHVTPALAIIDIIRAREPDSQFAYIGTEKGIEKRLAEKEGIPFYPIKIQGVSRSISPKNIKTAYLVMTAPAKAKKIIQKFKPDVVIGTGGYVSWAPLKAAAELGIPTIIHESNSVPGLAVRRLESKVDTILTNFEGTRNCLKERDKTICVGNPIRTSFAGIDKAEARKKLGIDDSVRFVVLSFGGSLGAPKLNEAAIDIMREFSSKHDDVEHFHSGGRNYYKNAMQIFAGYSLEKNKHLDIKEYIYDMSLYMAAADLCVCRAGAMTLTELAMLGKPAILIPSPNVTDNHQYKNAKALADKGAAILIQESELSSDLIASTVERLYSTPSELERMSRAVKSFANPSVGDEIYKEISKLVRCKEKIKRKEG
ncbi:MAG: undecaprenyldiphospho-muramoylpentapeptide beta-N-acetylglucosaminyltransferase [Clostridia bacterium]|nr:undecaprenyldiphospho-muramoylpentapeptide beta-N-acetylglucosaminyltransferase [Clostridia bacterium]